MKKLVILLFILVPLILLAGLFLKPSVIYEQLMARQLYDKRLAQTKDAQFPMYVKPKDEYKIILVGDSLTLFLGDGSEITKVLESNYPNKKISIDNFSIGSTSLETLPDRLANGAVRGTESLFPILSRDFDVIIIESHGNNPFNMPLEDALKKQNEILDKSVELIRRSKPKAVIIFLATIAPNRQRYGDGVLDISNEDRVNFAQERMEYIKNHIKYAQDHKIPLISVYEKTLTSEGDGNIDYLESHDFIHPSPTGIKFICREIADFLFQNRILPL